MIPEINVKLSKTEYRLLQSLKNDQELIRRKEQALEIKIKDFWDRVFLRGNIEGEYTQYQMRVTETGGITMALKPIKK